MFAVTLLGIDFNDSDLILFLLGSILTIIVAHFSIQGKEYTNEKFKKVGQTISNIPIIRISLVPIFEFFKYIFHLTIYVFSFLFLIIYPTNYFQINVYSKVSDLKKTDIYYLYLGNFNSSSNYLISPNDKLVKIGIVDSATNLDEILDLKGSFDFKGSLEAYKNSLPKSDSIIESIEDNSTFSIDTPVNIFKIPIAGELFQYYIKITKNE